jgi:hypothetical protein
MISGAWPLLLASLAATPAPLWKLPNGAPPPRETFAWLQRQPRGRLRTLAASALFLGTPYGIAPLGEGEPGRAPRLRFDEVDCQTFVEEAIALGEAERPEDLLATLDDLRYSGPPSFADRNHFMMSQWVPRNVAKGYLRDLTRSIAGPLTEVARKRLTPESWERRRGSRDIKLPPDRVPLGRWALPIVPLAHLEEIAEKIPDGTLLLIVRADRPAWPDRVTHLGLLVRHGRIPFLRHASNVFHRVRDEPLDHFVARNARYAWPVVGFSLLGIEAVHDRPPK